MKDLQAHAKKIRSDAAECLVLSNLVTEERRHLFGRIAEHLNSLALEIETEAVTAILDEPNVLPGQRVTFADQGEAPSDRRPTARTWRLFPWPLLAFLIVIAGASMWALFTASNQSKTGVDFQASANELATLLSNERDERKLFGDQLNALIARLDSLAKDLDDLKSLHAGSSAPSIKGAVNQEDTSPGMEAKPPPAPKMGTDAETSSTSSTGPTATDSAPATTNAVSESSDQVGTISTVRSETDLHKPTIGPAGCTHFRSFDPVSGTYTTFDGRRRQCR